MKLSFSGALLAVVSFAPALHAETLPEFHVGTCSYKATHIVMVKTEAAAQGKFRVVESWKGDLQKGAVLKLPALAKEGRGEMVLFLRDGTPGLMTMYIGHDAMCPGAHGQPERCNCNPEIEYYRISTPPKAKKGGRR